MDEDYGKTYGIEKLAELLIERGIEFFVKDELSLAFKDGVGNWHECWVAGADENRVNALIVVTPEQLLSVPDLNGIITENESLKAENERLRRENKELRDKIESHVACSGGIITLLAAGIEERDAENEKLTEQCSRLFDKTIELADENARLREFSSSLVEYVDPAGYQDICNVECPASARCRGKSMCEFPDWALEKALELGIEV